MKIDEKIGEGEELNSADIIGDIFYGLNGGVT